MTEDLVLQSPATMPDIIQLPTEIQTQLVKDREALRAQMGTVKLTADQRKALLVRATVEQIELKPTGEVYMPGVFYRQILHETFGPGGWAVRVGTPHLDVQEDAYKSTLYLQVMLVVGKCTRCQRSAMACDCGQPIEQCGLAEDVGAQAYHPKNARLSYDDAVAAATTNGLMRCCSKTLGVYANCWEPRWAEDARHQVGLKVWVSGYGQNAKSRPMWRRWDRLPLDGETGVVDGSPNADKRRPATVSQVIKAAAATVSEQKPLPGAIATPKVAGEQLGIIRPDKNGLWSVTTNVGVHFTDDERMARELERAKARGARVVFEDERINGQPRIYSYKVLDPNPTVAKR